MAGNPNMKQGAPSVNPGGRSREQRSAARHQASLIQKLTGNGKLTAEFALALLIAGGQPDADDGEDAEVMRKLAERTLRRYGLEKAPITVEDKKWAAKYLDDRGLGKPEVSIDVTSDGRAVGSVSLLPIELPALTDEQLEAWRAKLRAARNAALEAGSPPNDGVGDAG